jgi:hypothetical protein
MKKKPQARILKLLKIQTAKKDKKASLKKRAER